MASTHNQPISKGLKEPIGTQRETELMHRHDTTVTPTIPKSPQNKLLT